MPVDQVVQVVGEIAVPDGGHRSRSCLAVLGFVSLRFVLLGPGPLVLGHQVMDKHVEGDHADLPVELFEESGIAAPLANRVLVHGVAGGAGDGVVVVAAALLGANDRAVRLREVNVELAR
jgi:hypothetical protein